MPALEPVPAWRIVGNAVALGSARWHGSWRGDIVEVLEIAADEVLGLGATGVDVDDPDAIVEPEAGYSVAILDPVDEQTVIAHLEWDLHDGPVLAQGKVAGVPAKVHLGYDTLLVVQTCFADELERRLGWRS